MSKSFRDKAEEKRTSANNPAMMFISQPQAEEPQRNRVTLKAQPKASPLQAAQPKRAPQGAETKSRRLQLLLTPSLYEAVKERAEAEGLSVNETISELLQTALRI